MAGSIGLFIRQSFQSLNAFGGGHCPILYLMERFLPTCAGSGLSGSILNDFPFASTSSPQSALLIFIWMPSNNAIMRSP